MDNILSHLDEALKPFEFNSWGTAKLEKPLSLNIYKEWLKQGFQGEMSYLDSHLPAKENPQELLPSGKSAIVITENYWPDLESDEAIPKSLTPYISRYARGKDYHLWFQHKLEKAGSHLSELYPDNVFLAFADSKPVLERDLAYRAGLGWFGKNSCLIQRGQGSFFFIGEILTDLDLCNSRESSADHCGTCTRCIEACPTDAILEERQIDARKCISYWNIESKTTSPIFEKFDKWFFGCDICQEVCPWNVKVFGSLTTETIPDNKYQLIQDLKWILNSSNKELMRHFKETPLSRARGLGLKRNSIYLAYNQKLLELKEDILKYENHEVLGTIARKTLALFST